MCSFARFHVSNEPIALYFVLLPLKCASNPNLTIFVCMDVRLYHFAAMLKWSTPYFYHLFHFFFKCSIISFFFMLRHRRHRACNIFARTYYELWLQEENVGQEIMIEDLTVCIISSLSSRSCDKLLMTFQWYDCFLCSNHSKMRRKRKRKRMKRRANRIH